MWRAPKTGRVILSEQSPPSERAALTHSSWSFYRNGGRAFSRQAPRMEPVWIQATPPPLSEASLFYRQGWIRWPWTLNQLCCSGLRVLRDLPWCTGNFFYAPVSLSPGVFTALRSVSKFCISVLFIPPAHWAWLWWRSPSLKAVAISAVRWLNVQRWRADTDAIVSFRKITCTAHTHIQKDTPPPNHRYAYVASACAPDLAHSGDGHALVHLNESVLRPTSSSIVCTEEVWSNLPLSASLLLFDLLHVWSAHHLQLCFGVLGHILPVRLPRCQHWRDRYSYTRPVEFISLFLVLHLICYTVNPDSARNRSLPGKTVSGTRLQRHGEQWRQQHNQTVIKVAAH